jgi:hypothetical protein
MEFKYTELVCHIRHLLVVNGSFIILSKLRSASGMFCNHSMEFEEKFRPLVLPKSSCLFHQIFTVMFSELGLRSRHVYHEMSPWASLMNFRKRINPTVIGLNGFYKHLLRALTHVRSRRISVSIVSGYGLDDREIQIRPPEQTKDFSSNLCFQIGSGAHPASCPMGTGGPFPGGKARPGRDADHSPHLVLRSWMSRSYTTSPSCASIGVLWGCFTSTFLLTRVTLLFV